MSACVVPISCLLSQSYAPTAKTRGSFVKMFSSVELQPAPFKSKVWKDFGFKVFYDAQGVHAYVIAELKNQMPAVFGKEKKKEQLLNKLSDVYMKIQREHNISPGDFPPVLKFKEQLRKYDFSKFNPLRTKLIESLDRMLANDIPRLMGMIPLEKDTHVEESVRGGAFAVSHATNNPFASGACQGAALGAESDAWIIEEHKEEYDKLFKSLGPKAGKISGAVAKREMVKSKLPNTVLGKIWTLSDIDRDGALDEDEFAVAMYLIKIKLDDDDLPDELSPHLIPPSKRVSGASNGMDYD